MLKYQCGQEPAREEFFTPKFKLEARTYLQDVKMFCSDTVKNTACRLDITYLN